MADYQEKRTKVIECPNPGCPAPGKVKRDGFHGNDAQGKAIQRYECNACGKKFSARGHAMRRQFPADVIADALDSYYSGMSYKQVAEGLEDIYDVAEPSKHSVHDWVKGYTRMALDFMEGRVGPDGTPQTATGKRVKADVGPHWVADELFLPGGRSANVLLERDGQGQVALRLGRPPLAPPGKPGRNQGDGERRPANNAAESPGDGDNRRTWFLCGRDKSGVSEGPRSTWYPRASGTRSTTTCRRGCKVQLPPAHQDATRT